MGRRLGGTKTAATGEQQEHETVSARSVLSSSTSPIVFRVTRVVYDMVCMYMNTYYIIYELIRGSPFGQIPNFPFHRLQMVMLEWKSTHYRS